MAWRNTKSTRNVTHALTLDHLFIVCPARDAYPVDDRITVLPISETTGLRERIDALTCSAGTGAARRPRTGRP